MTVQIIIDVLMVAGTWKRVTKPEEKSKRG
jgi:hypothetical protein